MNMKRHQKHPDAKIIKVLKLCATSDIAAHQLGLSPSCVRGHAARLVAAGKMTIKDVLYRNHRRTYDYRINRDEIVRVLKTAESATEAAMALGITQATLRVHAQRMIMERKIKLSEILYRKTCKWRSGNGGQVTEKQELIKDLDLAQKRLEAVLELRKEKVDWRKIKAYEGGGTAVPIIMWSDWHCEEVIRPGEVPGCNNEFNPEIFKHRAEKCAQGTAYLINTCRPLGKIDQAVLHLGGDFISGHIHEELMETNAMAPIKALATMAQPAISAGIEHLLSKADLQKITVICNYGNHARISQRSRNKTGHDHSLEWLMYHEMQKEWRHEKRLEWIIAEAYHVYFKIFDYLVRFHHGDNVNYGGGVGGLSIPLLKAVGQWNKILRADLDCMCHYHQRRDYGPVLVNGSLSGYGAYALSIKADYERPQQQFALIQPKTGKTLAAEIFVE